MATFAAFLAICSLLPLSQSAYDAYVTSTGTNNNDCSINNPCGSLDIVLSNIKVAASEELIITMHGSNTVHTNQCWRTLNGNITLIIDSTSTTTELFDPCDEQCYDPMAGNPAYCFWPFDIGFNAHVKFYNFIWDKAWTAIHTSENSHFVCENCSFVGGGVVLQSGSATFSNTIFDAATVGWVGGDSFAPTHPVFQNSIMVTLSDCTITNIEEEYFMKIYSNPDYIRSIFVEHTTFISSTTFIYVYNQYTYSIVTNAISIYSSNTCKNA